MNNNIFDKGFKKIFWKINIFCGLVLLCGVLILLNYNGYFNKENTYFKTDASNLFYMNYDVSSLNDSKRNKAIKYGYELFQNTPNYIGPNNGNLENAYAGNNLSCNNCHLLSGTKPYSAPLIGIIKRFPQFRGRENKMGTIEERINGCMERSMNGKVMPVEGKEMKALISYLDWLGRYTPKDGNIEGKGFVKIEIPDRAVNLENGKNTFTKTCYVCHGADGQGVKFPNSNVYQYPPLWGDDSFNNGAGMTRVITAAQFIKANMPYGATYDYPILTDEEAYDVAGYINQQKRPTKTNLEIDFPDLKRKPVSTPYPPYVDEFSIEQHQLGPFQPIMAYYKKAYKIIKKK